MADIFISYSKKHAALTGELARDLEAEGYTTWWDTSLLPGDEFPDEIKRQLDAAKAVIVIWTVSSVNSQWVRAEATRAHAKGKLIALHQAGLDFQEIPLPFNTLHSELVSERAKIFAAFARRGIAPSNKKLEPAKGPAAPPDESPPARKVEPQKPKPGLISRWLGSQAEPEEASRASGKRKLGLKPGKSFRDFDAGPEMVVVPGGTFMMGSEDGVGGDYQRHKVTISQAFAVGKYPVTFDEWDAAVAAGGVSHKPGDRGWGRGRRPVIDVSWDDAKAYIKWLSGKTGQPYRLLSEAEWEYACRNESDLGRHAWYSSNAGGETHPVGEKAANGFGLHDMHGNVWEWCEDPWNGNYNGAPDDGSAWTTGGSGGRVLRGGSWNDSPRDLRAACRSYYYPQGRCGAFGFRVALGWQDLNR